MVGRQASSAAQVSTVLKVVRTLPQGGSTNLGLGYAPEVRQLRIREPAAGSLPPSWRDRVERQGLQVGSFPVIIDI